MPLLVPPGEPCEQSTTAAEVRSALDLALAQYIVDDRAGFTATTSQAAAAIACLGELLEPKDCARWNTIQAISALYALQRAEAVAELRTLHTLHPGWTIPPDVAPPTQYLDSLYQEASQLPPVTWEPMDAPRHTQVWVEGAPRVDRPAELPVLMQVQDRRGRVYLTMEAAPGAPIPAPRGPAVLRISAATSAAAAAGLGAWAIQNRACFWRCDEPDAEATRRWERDQVLVPAAATSSALALGLGAWLVLGW